MNSLFRTFSYILVAVIFSFVSTQSLAVPKSKKPCSEQGKPSATHKCCNGKWQSPSADCEAINSNNANNKEMKAKKRSFDLRI